MTVPREPGDDRRADWTDDDMRLRASMAAEAPPRPRRRDEDLNDFPQADPELAERRTGVGRIALYAVAALLIIGAVLYGVSQNGTTTASNPEPANTAANTPNPPQPPVRNVTPGPNAQPGTTTGSASGTPAPTRPAAPVPGGTR
jgi:hypothetical protein